MILLVVIGSILTGTGYFDKVVSLNTVDKLVSKLLSLVKYCDDVKKNVNINLLIDNLIFSFGGE